MTSYAPHLSIANTYEIMHAMLIQTHTNVFFAIIIAATPKKKLLQTAIVWQRVRRTNNMQLKCNSCSIQETIKTSNVHVTVTNVTL